MPIKSLYFHDWQLEEMKETISYFGRSQFISKALEEQFEEDRKNGLLEFGGRKTITANVDREVLTKIERLTKEKKIISVCEFARRAVTNKLLKNREYRKLRLYREKLEKDMVYIPGMNGDKPFNTRRLEYERG